MTEYWTDLQLFADEAAAASSASQSPAPSPEGKAPETGDAAGGTPSTGAAGAENAAETAATNAATNAAETPKPDRKAAWAAMISGEYKDLYQDAVQRALGRRLKSTEADVQKLGKLAPTLDLLAHRYWIDPAGMDPDALY